MLVIILQDKQFSSGEFNINPFNNEIAALDSAVQRIQPKLMDLLCNRANRPGDVIIRKALIVTVWTDAGDESQSRAISLLRKYLRSHPDGTEIIKPVPKCSYRLIASVRCHDGDEAPPQEQFSTSLQTR